MSNIIWTPQPKQKLFQSCPEFEALYGGAAGGGKSDALVVEALRQVEHPSYQGLLMRKTYPQLMELINRSQEIYPKIFPRAKYNGSEHVWHFGGNRGMIRFGSMNHTKDKLNYQGHQYQFIGVDELTHFLYEEYVFLMSRCRARDAGLWCYIRDTANPGGPGHGWVKDRFISAMAPYQRKYEHFYDKELKQWRVRDRIFIPATIYDNKKLLENDPNYLATLSLLPDAERKALLEGNWDSFDGQVFGEWKNDPAHYKDHLNTHVVRAFEVPKEWKRFRAYDFGYSKPFSVGWYAMDNDGRLFRYRELYGCTKQPNTGVKWEPTKIAAKIKEIEDKYEKGNTIIGIADPSIWDESRGESVAAMMEGQGIYFDKADNTRIAGKMQIHFRMSFDTDGRPMLYVFDTCPHFIRTIPSLVYDSFDVEDVDTKQEDHCLTGDTIVNTSNGNIPIQELVGTIGYVYSHDNQLHKYYDCRKTQRNVDIYEIELEDGRKVKATSNHKFMLSDGTWKMLKDLTVFDDIKTIM